MKLHELLSKHTNQEIAENVVRLYPDQDYDGYLYALTQLRNIDPVDSKDNMRIVIEPCHDLDTGYYSSVSGMNGQSRKEASVGDDDSLEEQRWALDFTDWNLWLGMELDRAVFWSYSELDALAHIMYELTFSGFNESDMLKDKQAVMDAAKDLESMELKDLDTLDDLFSGGASPKLE